MGNYGIKIAKPGKKVTSGLKDLIFHSSYPVLKIKSTGTGTINYTNDGSEQDVLVASHDLGYIPIVRFMIQWYDIDSAVKRTDYRNAPFIDTLVGGSVYFRANPYSDNSNLRLSVSSFDGNGGSISLDYLYFIYYDPDEDI